MNHNKILSAELKERLSKITLFPFTKPFLSLLTDKGIGYSFLTNNPSKSVADYLGKLKTLGIEATEDNMYTTSLAAIDYIKTNFPQARRLFLLGTPSMVSQFEKAGFESCEDSSSGILSAGSYCEGYRGTGRIACFKSEAEIIIYCI